MKKSFEINLGGRIFRIDEDAYELLNGYMESLKGCFSKRDGGDEIVSDIEARLGELCEERMHKGAARIVDYAMVEEVIARMGKPESMVEGFADETDAGGRKGWSRVWIIGIAASVIIAFIFFGFKSFNVNNTPHDAENNTAHTYDTASTLAEFLHQVKYEYDFRGAFFKTSGDTVNISELDLGALRDSFMMPDNYAGDKCARLMWINLEFGEKRNPFPFMSEAVQLDGRVMWRLAPRAEWVNYMRTPSSVPTIEIEGEFEPGYKTAEIRCVVDTMKRGIWIPRTRCKGMGTINISNASIPEWTVQFGEDLFTLKERPECVEMFLELNSSADTLPGLGIQAVEEQVRILTKFGKTIYSLRTRK